MSPISPELSETQESFRILPYRIIEKFDNTLKLYGDDHLVGNCAPFLAYFKIDSHESITIFGVESERQIITNGYPYPNPIAMWRGINLFQSLPFVFSNTLSLCIKVYDEEYWDQDAASGLFRQELSAQGIAGGDLLGRFMRTRKISKDLKENISHTREQYPDPNTIGFWISALSAQKIIVNAIEIHKLLLIERIKESSQLRSSLNWQESLLQEYLAKQNMEI